ncbi:alpha/beta fold hydrolase [Sphingosinicella rhizophila]|uniref:Alpha/beta hydrolase n=1 Tax=Sphingosinicella rhizophila TaxID=3050082 RepID=A0ABU3QB41_9SPHN|nr:alpha/beta hydrolase [Sphingosinicella sp. GR2756]MDT9600601.1 alpha/beta hydrolase [Sphingosinicella sp. GR2756]
MKSLTAADGTEIWFATHGDPLRPALFLGPHFYASFGRTDGDDTDKWIDGLKEDFFLIVADYPRGFGRTGNPLGMDFTPGIAAAEYERIAEAAGVERFGWVGYSYGGAIGVQVACRSDRVSALAVGGFPPLDAPYQDMVDITTRMATAMEAAGGVDPKLLWSSVGFYSPLPQWPEDEEMAKLEIPRMAFMGTEDIGVPLHGVDLPLAAILREAEPAMKRMGWQVAWLEGQDHVTTIEAAVSLPAVRDFFRKSLLSN